jgi:two-component system sensor histidine kinase VicK
MPAFAFVASMSSREGMFWPLLITAMVAGVGLRHVEAGTPDVTPLFVGMYVAIMIISTMMTYVIDVVGNRLSELMIKNKQQVQESEARYDILLDSVGDGLIAVDETGVIQFVNQAALDYLKVDRKSLEGQVLSSSVFIKSERGHILRSGEYPVTQTLKDGERRSYDLTSKDTYRIVDGDNKEFPASLNITPVKINGVLHGAIMLFSDITDADTMERAKSEFVSLASHQLRTPLNVVSWYAEKLLKEKKGPLNERQKDYVTEISTNNRRMIDLVGDLLNVSRVDLDRVKREHEEVDLTQLLSDLIQEIKPLIEEKKLEFTTDSPETGVILRDNDKSLMTMIVQNMLSNAVKYTPESGSVSVHLGFVKAGMHLNHSSEKTALTNGIVLKVVDSGIGIPKSQQAKIFSKLFRADNVQVMDVEGTGLGLYVSNSFTKALGGQLWFDSEEGKGTSFYLFMPT